jgi:N-terminal domain of anti-restriction factor ArdC
MPRKRPTAAQIARAKARREELSDRLDAFLAANHGETFTYAKITGGYYSDRNGAMIAMQAAERDLDVTAVGAYDDWRAAGRQVRRGEHALRIWAPAGEYPSDPDDPDSPKRKRFRPAPVFAFEQTDPLADLDPAEAEEVAS